MAYVVMENPTETDLWNRQFMGSQINLVIVNLLTCFLSFGVILKLYVVIYEQEGNLN